MAMSTYEQILDLTKKLKLPEQLELLEAISRLVRRRVVAADPERSILDLEGLGADLWENIDAQQYVNEERASWDS